MSIKLKGSTDGSVTLQAPADTSPTGTDKTLTLPTTTGSANQFVKNGGTAGELEYSSMVETSTGVGIGTTSPGSFDTEANKLVVGTGTGDQGITIYSGPNSTDFGSIFFADGTSGGAEKRGQIRYQQSSEVMSFVTNTTERMRIKANGDLGVFGGSDSLWIGHSEGASAATSGRNFITGRHSATTTFTGTQSFVVRTNGNVGNTNNDYGGLSDVKLKENIVDATSQWEDIKGIRVRKYNFKEETGHETFTQLGVIAQEIETVSPGLVTESPDLDEEGNDLGTVTKSVSYSVLYMKAVKALQEAMDRIETLEAKVAALEAA